MGLVSKVKTIGPAQMGKMMMILNNRNMQISVLEINTEGIISLLNRLLYLSDGRHLKKVGMCIWHLNCLRPSMCCKLPVCLGTINTFQ